tara:strand:- start:1610 stop:2086 length:477 start_codon:yes stop_codon:yes gene_type:complete
MMLKKRTAVLALVAEYEKVIRELQVVIEGISPTNLVAILDETTTNSDCKSIQTILTHVVSAGYSYCIYIQNQKDANAKRPDKRYHSSISDYQKELDAVIAFTQKTFASIEDEELEEYDNSKKIMTSWGQLYDIEQLIEHAIVHILRHRRQIENFKKNY